MIGKEVLHYKVTEKLGEGGMGLVYKAHDTKLDRMVALKLLPKYVATNNDEMERFKIEAKSAAALNHPNIATVYAIEEESLSDGSILNFIVMEYIDGIELQQKIHSEEILFEEAIELAKQIVSGLASAHRKNIIHRDIKSSNIMLNSDGRIKIMDFGLAKISDGSMLTKAGTLLGTAAYMSPEQAQELEVDHRTDIWAFGVVFYELLSKKLPFAGEYEYSIIYSILNDEYEPISNFISNVPKKIDDILLKLLAKNPDERYNSFEDVFEDLDEVSMSLQEQSIQIKNRLNTVNSAQIDGNINKSILRSEGERRNLTVLICSFSLSSTISEELDPEDVGEILPYCFDISRKVIDRFGGFLYNLSGMEQTIIFGYPEAYEDSTKRSVLTALGIREGISAYSSKIEQKFNLSVNCKLSIDTGLMLIKQSSTKPNNIDLIGEALVNSSKLQGVLSENSIVITELLARIVAGFFELKEIDSHLSGRYSPNEKLFAVLHESQARSRIEVSLISGLTPLTGREKEFNLLVHSWENILDNIGQVISLRGEPGIGKSRLVQEIKQHVAQNPQAWLIESFCSPFYESSPLQPIIELMERSVLNFEKGIDNSGKLKKIEGFLVQYGFDLSESVPLICSLLSVETGDGYQPLSLTPEAQKQRINILLINLLIKRAEQQPVLFVVDDLQWSDPTTLDLLGTLIEHIQTTKVLLLLTYRPSFVEPWEAGPHINRISLSRLPKKEIDNFILKITNGKAFPAKLVDEIAVKTDGVPLFVEELTKMVLNTGYVVETDIGYVVDNNSKELSIPATLKDSLMARLDKMGSAKELTQLGATIGREFSYDLIKYISGMEDKRLVVELSKLVKAEILYRKGFVGEERFIFKHALIQDTAYQSLLKKKREEIHKNIVSVLEDKFSELKEAHPEIFAHHYSAARMFPEAIQYWYQAGVISFQRSANLESIEQLKKGLSLINKLHEDNDKNQSELMLLSVLGPATLAIKGFGADEVGNIFSRSNELCSIIGETPFLFPSIWGQWVYNLVRSNLLEATKLSDKMIELGEDLQESSMLIEGYWTQGDNYFWRGKLNEAKAFLEKAIQIYDPKIHHMNAYLFGQDPMVAAHCYLSYANWYLGNVDEAINNTESALQIARDLNHPFSIGWALAFNTMVHGFRKDTELTLKYAKETIEYCTEQAYPFWITAAQIMYGWAISESNSIEEGLKIMEEGLAGFSQIGSVAVFPLFQGLIAEKQNELGLTEKALNSINNAIEIAVSNKEIASEIDLYRIKANILLKSEKDLTEDPLAYFDKAIEIADNFDAKARKLQVINDLAELEICNGKIASAKDRLDEICSGFNQGYDTRDYKKAKQLLEKISVTI